ncbi:MAG: peptidoglycan-binding protein [Patescibacteria group bacterium]
MTFSLRYYVQIVCVFALFVCASYTYAANDTWENISPNGALSSSFNTIATAGDYVYLGTDNGIYKSLDSGQNWVAVNTGLSTLSIRAISVGFIYDSNSSTYTANGSTYVFIATDSGVYYSTLGGASWTAVNSGLTDLNVTDIEIDQSQATQGSFTNIYAATPSGVFRSVNNGSSWTLQNTGMSGLAVTKITSDYGNGKIYALTSTNVLYGSTLRSFSGVDESWTLSFQSSGTTTTDVSILSPVGQIAWLSTSAGILKSDTNGQNWESKNIGLPSATVNTVVSDYSNANVAYTAVSGNGIYRTLNEALQTPQWTSINIGLTDLEVAEIKPNPTDSDIVFAIGASGVYRLTLSTTTVDLTPPSTITDLQATGSAFQNNTVLTWTSPGNDGIYGTSTSYIIRYSTSTINESNWSQATFAILQPTPYAYGSSSIYYMFNLTGNLQYYFAIKSFDGTNYSALSNVVSVAALSDIAAPDAPASVSTSDVTTTTLTLTWPAATDDVGVVGYVIYKDSIAIATTTSGLTYSVSGLTSGTAYSFEIKAYDAQGYYSTAATVSVSTAVEVSSGGSSSGGSSGSSGASSAGGGSSGGAAPAAVSTPTVSSSTPTISNIATNCPVGFVCSAASSGVGAKYNFIRDLKLGMSHPDVKVLQQYLNSQGFVVAAKGSGSVGLESNYFGPATRVAVIKFQLKNKILPAAGFFGLKSRTFINGLSTGTKVASVPLNTPLVVTKTPVTLVSSKIILKVGSSGIDVKNLRTKLRSLGYFASYGSSAKVPASAAVETTYFGVDTQNALKKYQCDQKIVCSGAPATTGWGNLGPKTRSILGL